MPDFEIKSFDQLPFIQATLSLGASPANLTEATRVDFIMRAANGGAVKIDAQATILDAAAGVVRYEWKPGDTDTPGNYQAEWEVHWASGLPQTFPKRTYHTIEVLADLDGNATPAVA